MTDRLVDPRDAADVLVRRVERQWPSAVCRELDGLEPWRTSVPLSAGVTTGSHLARLGFAAVHDWEQAWQAVPVAPGIELATRRVSVERVARELPASLVVTGLDAARTFVSVVAERPWHLDLDRARRVGRRVRDAGGRLTPGSLAAVHGLADHDVDAVVAAIAWLAHHPDISGWTARQLPVPAMHSKWLATHGALLRDLTGREVHAQVRPRLAVVHLTYVDPGHLASGRRRHDAWTTGDVHDLAYEPSTVLVVENRDCRLWFPPLPGTVVVEGDGKAAAAVLAGVEWVCRATNLAYWGDVDADGFAILDHLRSTLRRAGGLSPVESILMDGSALARYGHLGVSHGADGRLLGPATTVLAHLTDGEREAYDAVATAGPAPVRRIEQERMPITDAVAALAAQVARSGGVG